MMFDNTPVAPSSRWETLRNHLPVLLLVVAAIGVAGGVHLASTTLAAIAAGHLVLAGILFALRGLRDRRAGALPR